MTLGNAIIEARVLKKSGDLRSLKYKGIELLTDRSGHPGGYWSHDTSGGKGLGANTLTLTVPGGNIHAGVVYDYLRLELSDE